MLSFAFMNMMQKTSGGEVVAFSARLWRDAPRRDSRSGEAVKELVAELARVQFSRRILKSGDFSYQKVHDAERRATMRLRRPIIYRPTFFATHRPLSQERAKMRGRKKKSSSSARLEHLCNAS